MVRWWLCHELVGRCTVYSCVVWRVVILINCYWFRRVPAQSRRPFETASFDRLVCHGLWSSRSTCMWLFDPRCTNCCFQNTLGAHYPDICVVNNLKDTQEEWIPTFEQSCVHLALRIYIFYMRYSKTFNIVLKVPRCIYKRLPGTGVLPGPYLRKGRTKPNILTQQELSWPTASLLLPRTNKNIVKYSWIFFFYYFNKSKHIFLDYLR